MSRQYYVYILASPARHLYVGITNNLVRRLAEHRSCLKPGSWVQQHDVTRLVYFEVTYDARAAIAREKQIMGWKRRRKIELIEVGNPEWTDLAPAPRYAQADKRHLTRGSTSLASPSSLGRVVATGSPSLRSMLIASSLDPVSIASRPRSR